MTIWWLRQDLARMSRDNWAGTFGLTVGRQLVTRSSPPCGVIFWIMHSNAGAELLWSWHDRGGVRGDGLHSYPQSVHAITFTSTFIGALNSWRARPTQANPSYPAGLT